MRVWTKKRGSINAVVLMATPCPKSLHGKGEKGSHPTFLKRPRCCAGNFTFTLCWHAPWPRKASSAGKGGVGQATRAALLGGAFPGLQSSSSQACRACRNKQLVVCRQRCTGLAWRRPSQPKSGRTRHVGSWAGGTECSSPQASGSVCLDSPVAEWSFCCARGRSTFAERCGRSRFAPRDTYAGRHLGR